MSIDMKQLANNLLAIAERAAPLVGLDDEFQSGKQLYEAVTQTINDVKHDLASDDQDALQVSLDALAARVNSHADRTIESLK